MDTLVATKIEQPVSKPNETLKTDVIPDNVGEDTKMPPSLRVEAKRLPLVVDILDAKEAYDTFDVPYLSENIDNLVNQEIKRRGLDDNEKSYKSLIDEIIIKLHLPTEATIWSKLEKILDYLRINQKMADAIREKEELLSADPLTLSPDKMKKLWEMSHG